MGDKNDLERILTGHVEPRDLAFPLLLDITGNFSEKRKIGEGGFGVVFKGELQNGIVAVKRIIVGEHNVDDITFRREVEILMKMRDHPNIVRFLGFCSTGQDKFIKVTGSTQNIWAQQRERLLCFNYIGNGSLDEHITDELRGLDWSTRYDIINGICRGLDYLHEQNIIHMDLKPSNIMLDNHMVPKITDFGLSRRDKNTHTSGTRFVTQGYCAPEYEKDGKTTRKADIYSLGMIIVELVTGRRGLPNNNYDVLRRWRHRLLTLLKYQAHQITRCMEIAIECRKPDPGNRPSIGDILDDLRQMERDNVYIGQESTYLEDDMLGIVPLELPFSFKPNKEMSWSVRLTNKTKACFAFNIEKPSKHYTIQPDKGIVTPGYNDCLVKITSQPQERALQVIENADKFIVRSTKVTADLRGEDITRYILHEEVPGKVVDEVDILVVYEKDSRKRGQDPNVTVEEVPPKCMAINSSSYEDGTQGQLDRRNFHPPENFSHRQPTNKTYLPRVSDRAMDVTRGAMGSLLHKLGELLKDEFNLDMSVKEDIKSLSKELMKMQEVLHKMSEVQQDNLAVIVKDWASNVREMSYDLEDFVDGFLVHSEPDSSKSNFKELTHDMCLLLEKGQSHHQIGNLIKQHMCKQVQDKEKNHIECNVDNLVANAAATVTKNIDPRMLVQFQRSKQLVGIQEPRDDLIKKLSQVSEQELRIFSIYGGGGLGKTTLAKSVYDKLEGQFHPMAFVSVGREPNEMQVLRDIIDELSNDSSTATLDVKHLIKELHKLLKNKRYFIVIDDIWESSAWSIIERAFPESNLGSRVVITTRIHSVANVACSNRNCVDEMKALNDQDSRTLFLSRIFGMEDACPDVPEDILAVILKKCGGLPLAIISIASLVAEDPTTWSRWDYVRNSLIALFEEYNPTLTNMERILDLSYRHLPDHLKTCLLHVCMYPEDGEIDKNDLLRQWVAEGFVVSRNSRLDVEDVAEEYFKELISMCMIQPERIEDYSNEVLSCKVHDIILDLMRSKSSDENFSHVTYGSKTWAHGEIRRISVYCNGKEDSAIFETVKRSLSHARSALFHYVSPVPYLPVFKYVRVLHIRLPYLQHLDVTVITRLFLLRYLKIDLSSQVFKLPDKIGELRHLETMDLKGCILEKYPSDIVCLPWLSHLSYWWHGIALPDGVERLKSLRTLEGVRLSKSSAENIKGLGKLANLRRLQIHLGYSGDWEEPTRAMCMDALHSSISKISSSLRIFTLRRDDSHFRDIEFDMQYILDVPLGWSSMTLFPDGSAIRELNLYGCRFERCPWWISQLSNLHKFTVMVREVADGLNLVSGLSSLAFFQLMICGVEVEEQKEESVVIPGGGAFKALKQLDLRCPMATLTFEPGTMPRLNMLNLWFRYEMTPQFLPVGIQHLPAPTLKEMGLCVVEGSMEVKVKGSEDWDDDMWEIYRDSDRYRDKVEKHDRKLKAMLQKAFKEHHPGADIYLEIGDSDEDDNKEEDDNNEEEDDNNEEEDEEFNFTEYDEIVDDEVYYSTEEDDEAAYQLNGSRISAHVHPDHTRQLVQLIEAQQDSGGTNITTDTALAPVVDTSLRLAVREGWQSGQGEGFSEDDDKREDCCKEEDDEAAYQVNKSQTSAQVRADTRQLLQLIQEHKVSGTMGIEETEVSLNPMVDTSLHLAVGSKEQQVGHGEGFAGLESLHLSSSSSLDLLTLAVASPLHCILPSANFRAGVKNDLLVQQGNNDMLLSDGDYYCSEQDDEPAYQGNGSKASAEGQAIKRQLAPLIEAQEDYGMMNTDIYVPQVVDTSLHLEDRSEGKQSGRSHIS